MQEFDRIANGNKMKQEIINNPDMLYKDLLEEQIERGKLKNALL